MAVSDAQYQQLLNRVSALEQAYNNLAVAISKFTTFEQINQLNVLYQTNADDIRTQVEALEERVTAIEEEPLT
jgi:prefoldin subunit 5